MSWNIDSEPREGADRIHAHWTGVRPAYEASIESGDQVQRTSMGGSTHAELTRFDKPLMGIFRWEANIKNPVAVLRWKNDPDGDVQVEEVPLG
jgi:hypothetical protein